jgi:hypothetical protein
LLWNSPMGSIGLEECAVCLGGGSISGDVITLPCKHSFHSKCVLQWLTRRCLCPLCRADVRPHLNRRAASVAADPGRVLRGVPSRRRI